MKSRHIVPDPEVRKAAGIKGRACRNRMTNCPSTPHDAGVLCCANGRALARLIFRILRETVGAIILTTDPEKARQTLRLFESEPEMGQPIHD